jgi:hypothetical protein
MMKPFGEREYFAEPGATPIGLLHAYPVSTDPKNEAKKDSPRGHEGTKESQETNNQQAFLRAFVFS